MSHTSIHLANGKPPLPYSIGSEIHANAHEPPSPPDDIAFFPTGRLLDECRNLPPLEFCLLHNPTTGHSRPGKVTLKITATIRTSDCKTSQVVKVRVVAADETTMVSSLVGSSLEIVAKFYDPLYWDLEEWYCDNFKGADSHYAHEARAYKHLKPVQGSDVPRYYGSYSTEISAGGRSHRDVRFILIEAVPGLPLNKLSPRDYSVQQRQQIMTAFLNAQRRIRRYDVGHSDEHPRNVILSGFSHGNQKANIRIIDFDSSSYGFLSSVNLIPEADGDIRPLEPVSSTRLRWSREYSEEILSDFGSWIRGWDWDAWLTHDYEP